MIDLAELYEIKIASDGEAMLLCILILAEGFGLEIRDAITTAVLETLCRLIGTSLMSRVAASAVPVLGSAIGAGWNYTSTVGIGAAAIEYMKTKSKAHCQAAA